ncbi:P-loop NTPase fold protein [Vibrio splendidus]|uniref:P-loop NTPase fold protein n=1 Tax=Vibrio splendidus TaxID=29497 RepID=A0AA43G167_VIBSP|nr:P-loop NTPase fold protein [Vibrio splendidus]MDH5923681.1 P-loop NTPase fold protein [Vibrio splendidus]
MWSDKESSLDFLNFSETAESIKELITEKELMPISVGVFGDWGAGKSTILELTKNSISSEEQEYIQVHFDAWMYQGYDDAKAALLETIASTLIQQAENDASLSKKAIEFASRVDIIRSLGLLMDGGAALAGIPTMGGFQKLVGLFSGGEDGELDIGDAKDTLDGVAQIAKDNKNNIRPKKTFSPPKEIKEFRNAYSNLLEEFDKPLIVYVDNLDRCSPFNAISTLEAIRLFLFLPNTAFVIAADEDMIRLAVPEYHKGASQRHQTDYLDKLIQIPVHVPRPGTLEIRAYLMMLTAQDHGVTSEQLEELRKNLETSLQLSWKLSPVSIDELLEIDKVRDVRNKGELRSKFIVAEQLAPLLAESSNINGNPRIVKRLLNQVRMRRKTALRRGMQLDERTITKLVIFERCLGNQATNKLYELIDAESGSPKILARLEDPTIQFDDIELPEEWKLDSTFLKKWSKLPPMFADINLTPAAYLSRESIPMGSVNAVMSGAAQNLVRVLMEQTERLSPTSKNAIVAAPKEDYLAVMDGLIENLRGMSDWVKVPSGMYGARLLALQDLRCKQTLLAYLKELPKQRWLERIIKELEGKV